MSKIATDIDHHVGVRMHDRRRALGMSQEQLASAIGVTFQQVQKYEKGVNRVSASRLQRAAEALDVDIGYFYEGLPMSTTRETAPAVLDEAISPQVRDRLRLMRAFEAIADAGVRQALITLAEASVRGGGGEA